MNSCRSQCRGQREAINGLYGRLLTFNSVATDDGTAALTALRHVAVDSGFPLAGATTPCETLGEGCPPGAGGGSGGGGGDDFASSAGGIVVILLAVLLLLGLAACGAYCGLRAWRKHQRPMLSGALKSDGDGKYTMGATSAAVEPAEDGKEGKEAAGGGGGGVAAVAAAVRQSVSGRSDSSSKVRCCLLVSLPPRSVLFRAPCAVDGCSRHAGTAPRRCLQLSFALSMRIFFFSFCFCCALTQAEHLQVGIGRSAVGIGRSAVATGEVKKFKDEITGEEHIAAKVRSTLSFPVSDVCFGVS